MTALAIAITLASLSIGLSAGILAEMCRIARRLDELELGSMEISDDIGDIPPLDMQFHHHFAAGNAETIIWYQKTRRQPPTDDPKAPVNA